MIAFHSHLGQLSRQLQETSSSEILTAFCNHCQAELPLLITDELADYPVDDLYPEIVFHLDLCRTCLREYVVLSKLITATLYGEEVV